MIAPIGMTDGPSHAILQIRQKNKASPFGCFRSRSNWVADIYFGNKIQETKHKQIAPFINLFFVGDE